MLSEHQDANLLAKAEALFKEADEAYVSALTKDPLCLEGLVQSAQLKVFMGKFDEALPMLERAWPLTRSRDELIEVLQMLAQAKSHTNAVAILNAF